MAPSPELGREHRPGVCPKRARIVARSTDPPERTTILCLDELGPVSPRTFPLAPGWSPDGQALTLTAPARNTVGFQRLLAAIDAANPEGDLYLIADNLSSHKRAPIQAWLAEHPRVHVVPLPTGACWLNLIEGWWRLFRREALAGQSFADHTELATATHLATTQLNRRAKPWVWGRPPRRHRQLRRCFVYRL